MMTTKDVGEDDPARSTMRSTRRYVNANVDVEVEVRDLAALEVLLLNLMGLNSSTSRPHTDSVKALW
jgi:hypothetical protein